tara:strand:- start:791 stop:955 length:165 start_codon:yes stop_codon:yes gene_type:complete
MKLGFGISLTTIKGFKTAEQRQVSTFKARVIADSGIFEAKACAEVQLTILSKIQ